MVGIGIGDLLETKEGIYFIVDFPLVSGSFTVLMRHIRFKHRTEDAYRHFKRARPKTVLKWLSTGKAKKVYEFPRTRAT